jgi:CRISPR/Cas system-associated endoribonuclease Cas2
LAHHTDLPEPVKTVPPQLMRKTHMTALITYDLNKETTRPKIVKAIKEKYPTWAKLSESSYAVSTAATPKQIFDSLAGLLDSNDQLFVITLENPWWGIGPDDVTRWLRDNL